MTHFHSTPNPQHQGENDSRSMTFMIPLRARLLTILASVLSVGMVLVSPQIVDGDDWNQWLGPNRDSVWNESGVITEIPKDGLNLVWRAPISAGFSGPAVADGRVFITDFVREKGDPTFDAGKRSKLSGIERIHCLDQKTGEKVWTKEFKREYNMSYALGPRATPTVDGDKVYCLGAEGHLQCFDAAKGDVIWQRDLKKDYGLDECPMWGFSAHPLVHGDSLYCVVGGKESVAVAFNKNDGRELWRSLSAKSQGYCPPTMINAGGTDQLLIFHPEGVHSLDPSSGKVFWNVKLAPAYDMSIIAPIKHGDYLLITALQNATVLLKLDKAKPAVTEVWRGKGTNPDHNPPVVFENHIYGVDVKGRMRCIDLVSGERKWESLATCPNGRPASSTTGFVVRNGNHWYITTEQGELMIAKMTPEGFEEIGRAKMVEPTAENWGRKIVWSHPAFAGKCVFARNDKEIVCYSLAK
ncbi:MAG: PQQ-binding-like beta-propeller repeat protein [Planctomycetota bacterium]